MWIEYDQEQIPNCEQKRHLHYLSNMFNMPKLMAFFTYWGHIIWNQFQIDSLDSKHLSKFHGAYTDKWYKWIR